MFVSHFRLGSKIAIGTMAELDMLELTAAKHAWMRDIVLLDPNSSGAALSTRSNGQRIDFPLICRRRKVGSRARARPDCSACLVTSGSFIRVVCANCPNKTSVNPPTNCSRSTFFEPSLICAKVKTIAGEAGAI